jgi:SecD/SecF fusion protein
MSRRTFTGIIVLGAIVLSLLYLAQPWNTMRGINEPTIKLGLDLQGGLRVVLEAEEANPTPEDLDVARNVIENRVNQFGVSEPLVQTSGNNRIVVELPGLSSEDQDRALGLIGQSAVLEFRLVTTSANNKTDAELTPEDLEDIAFTGEILRDARADFNRVGGATLGGALVLFDIKPEFAQEFGDFTGNNIGRRMAIVLDGVVQTAPSINGRISASGQIEGVGTIEEASDTALVLRSGSLPISLNVAEVRAIGPTLGQDAINSGTRAGIIGGVAVILVILFYYGPLFGGVLTVGLLLSMLFIFAALAGFGATLTLPGLAGLILTIGSALDGNVISFERVKENLRAGKGLKMAMRDGFNNSLPAIIDANMATVLAGLALYQYTSGPVRGFAVTLIIGIVASVFSNIVVVPFLLNVIATRMKRHYIPMGFSVPRIRFMKLAPTVLTVSAILAVAALALVFTRGLKQSVDFTGGTTALYQVDEATTVDDVRRAVDALAVEGISSGNATIQEVEDATISTATVTTEATDATTQETLEAATDTTATTGVPTKLISVRVGETANQETGSTFANDLVESLNATLLSTDFVGPSIGSDLRSGAFYAVLVAFGLILAYIGIRFWPNWIVAVAAVIAAVHDVGIVMGVLSLFNVEFSIPVLAALLFVVGYSLNDSIIIADRLRENLRKIRGQSYADIAELSVNQTLSRTIMTSGLTLIPIVALLIFGGSVLRDFSITLLIGLAFGTYSSIFVLSPIVVWFRNRFARGGVPVRKAA